MRSAFLLPLLAIVALALPAPQNIDFEVVDAAGEPTTVSFEPNAQPTVIYYDQAAAIADVKQALSEDPENPAPLEDASPSRLLRRAGCEAQTLGKGPVPDPDTPAAFATYAAFASAASQAVVPSGYNQAFSNLKASNNAYGYLGFSTLSTYDSELCASRCNKINGCAAINIYYERTPTLNPGDDCLNPTSSSMIKCVYWGGPVSEQNAKNTGQWRRNFQVLIAGSNGYVSKGIKTPAGYTEGTYLGNAATLAPNDCIGDGTFITSKMFNSGPYDAGLCAAACEAENAWLQSSTPAGTTPKSCQFFNTYLLLKNGVSTGQYCSLYTQAWSKDWAKNTGQYRGNDKYTIAYSYSFTNLTSPGKPRYNCDIAQASKVVQSSSLQPFCSSLFGYTTPVVTVTAPTTVFTTVQSTTTLPAQNAKRGDAVATPSALATFPASAITSACSLNANPVTVTTTTTLKPTISMTSTEVITVTPTPILTCYKIRPSVVDYNVEDIDTSKIEVRPESDGAAQIWYLDGASSVADATSKVINIVNTGTRRVVSGTAWQQLATTSQRSGSTSWKIEAGSSQGLFLIRNPSTQHVWDVESTYGIRGTKVLSWSYNGGGNQFWKFLPVSCPTGFAP